MALLKTPAQKAADKILADVRALLNKIALVDDSGYNAFWADPADIAAALGPAGVGVFTLHAMLNMVRVQAALLAGLPISFPGVALTPGADPTQAASYRLHPRRLDVHRERGRQLGDREHPTKG